MAVLAASLVPLAPHVLICKVLLLLLLLLLLRRLLCHNILELCAYLFSHIVLRVAVIPSLLPEVCILRILLGIHPVVLIELLKLVIFIKVDTSLSWVHGDDAGGETCIRASCKSFVLTVQAACVTITDAVWTRAAGGPLLWL